MDGIQLSLFGKTYPAHSPAILGETLEPCSKKSHKPIFQCLEVNGGQTPEWFEAKGFTRRGASSTVNIGVSPSVAKESFLSEVLEPIVPKKYRLTAIACAGILRRAEFAKCAKTMMSGQQHTFDFGRTSDRIQINADKAVTLQAGGGGAGAKSGLYLLPTICADTVGSLCASDAKYIGNQYVRDNKLVIQTECYNIGADQSSGMLSDNPYSGIYETDGNGGNQGGTVIVQELIDWIVRRLTPRECERLQGYPDDWTVLPKISDMPEADYLFFRDVFCTYRAINGKPVKKLPTKEQIIKWYNKLDKDSPRYRALGNSLAIPCALRVLDGIAETWKERIE